MTNMKPPQEGRNTGAPSLRGLQGRSATGLNGQAAKEEVSALWQGGWMPENISGVPAGRSVFHLTSPLIGLLARNSFWNSHPTGTVADDAPIVVTPRSRSLDKGQRRRAFFDSALSCLAGRFLCLRRLRPRRSSLDTTTGPAQPDSRHGTASNCGSAGRVYVRCF